VLNVYVEIYVVVVGIYDVIVTSYSDTEIEVVVVVAVSVIVDKDV
jgi:hypothetical protein